MADNNSRNGYIDTCKGILMIFVIIGHVLLGTLEENPVRYAIYSFHMPAFFFISGYLVNTEKLRTESLKQFISRYAFRIIVPWAIAVNVYFFIHYMIEGDSIIGYIKAYVVPYYHLWFSIGYMFCILAVFAAGKHIKNKQIIPSIITALGFFFVVLYLFRKASEYSNGIIKVIEYTIRPWHMLFFGLGMVVRLNPCVGAVTFLQKWKWIFIIVFICLLPIGYRNQNNPLEEFIRFLLLGIILLGFTADSLKLNIPFLSYLGKNSYPIYLWHVIGRALSLNTEFYYYITIGWILVLLICLRFLKEDSPIRKFIGR